MRRLSAVQQARIEVRSREIFREIVECENLRMPARYSSVLRSIQQQRVASRGMLDLLLSTHLLDCCKTPHTLIKHSGALTAAGVSSWLRHPRRTGSAASNRVRETFGRTANATVKTSEGKVQSDGLQKRVWNAA